ncbi:GerAB/ArcD/ProY family transporter [Bacillus sp. 7884-1]|uniref:GerAB/ArcD/ProY family transporter n=1 Tax=Bacillus sp. 7884-1 TaxID=2021693 RepID=UPI000BA601F9|nr:GerAB/ArcD/ProY family transporter [Bacillus sp. 7884-1]PAE38621.1 spore gernimation protein [Bacillus sp. 7884-1]
MIHLEKISIGSLVCLVILTQIGAHVLSIPYDESLHSGYDSWISLLLGGVIAQGIILIIYKLGKRYADRPLPSYIFEITGKPLGAIVNFLFAAYCVENSLIVIVNYSNVLSRWVLFETPWFVLIGVSCMIGAYIASSNLRSIAQITKLILIMFLICIVIIFVSGMGRGDVRNFLPVGNHGIGSIIKDSIPTLWAYSGFELLLYVFPFVSCHKKKDIFIAMSAANGFTTMIYVLVAFIVTYNFSESQLKVIPEPMVFILRKFNWPVVQSLDIVFMTIWLSVTTATVFVYLFLGARYLAFVRGKEIRKHSFLVWIFAIVCFTVGLWGSDKQWLFRISNFHNYATWFIIAIVPTILLLASIVRRKVAKG